MSCSYSCSNANPRWVITVRHSISLEAAGFIPGEFSPSAYMTSSFLYRPSGKRSKISRDAEAETVRSFHGAAWGCT